MGNQHSFLSGHSLHSLSTCCSFVTAGNFGEMSTKDFGPFSGGQWVGVYGWGSTILFLFF